MREPNELLQTYEARIYELQQLIEISKSLNAILEYHDLIDAILSSALGYMKAVEGGVFVQELLHSRKLKLHRSIEGIVPEHVHAYTLDPEHPACRYLNTVRQAVSFDELLDATGVTREALTPLSEFEPAAVTPLIGREELKGVLFVGAPVTGENLMPVNRDFLSTVGILAGVAVQNALLFEAATTDRLTGLKQRHVFEQMIRQYCELSRVAKQSVSVLMIDLDRFKSINDTYGHAAGDRILSSIAEMVRSCLRQTDIAARYGGEEFVVLLPGVDLDGAVKIAERIRNRVAAERLDPVDRTVTISIGAAEHKVAGKDTPDDLISRADQALYEAKRLGRNRVEMA